MANITRQTELTVGGKRLRLPTLFVSVSSVKTNFGPLEYLQFLSAVSPLPFLISAYDLYQMAQTDRDIALAVLRNQRADGQPVLMDSGNYECYWHRDSEWISEKFFSILRVVDVPLVFCLDNQKPTGDVVADCNDVIRRVSEAQEINRNSTVIGIAHGRPEVLPKLCYETAKRLMPLVLAVPERELGYGIRQRIQTVRNIRSALDDTGTYISLHLLGTGNPWSIALFTAAGADTFDGLEWCQTSTDAKTGQLNHFSHGDLFMGNRDGELTYTEQVLLHNLKFFSTWMSSLQGAHSEGKLQELVTQVLPSRVSAVLMDH